MCSLQHRLLHFQGGQNRYQYNDFLFFHVIALLGIRNVAYPYSGIPAPLLNECQAMLPEAQPSRSEAYIGRSTASMNSAPGHSFTHILQKDKGTNICLVQGLSNSLETLADTMSFTSSVASGFRLRLHIVAREAIPVPAPVCQKLLLAFCLLLLSTTRILRRFLGSRQANQGCLPDYLKLGHDLTYSFHIGLVPLWCHDPHRNKKSLTHRNWVYRRFGSLF